MRIAVAMISVLLGASLVVFAQTVPQRKSFAPDVPAVDRVGSAALRNSSVSARKVDLAPGASHSVPSSSHDYLVISLGDSKLTAAGVHTSFDLALSSGEMQVVTGGWPHKLINRSATSSQIVTVELARNIHPDRASCGLSAANCNEVRFGKSSRGEYSQSALFETDTAKLLRASIGPLATLQLHDDGRRHLIVALTPFHGRTEAAGFSLAPGDLFWISGGFVELANLDTAEARMLIVEVKD